MPVLMELELPGGTTAQYDRARAMVGLAEGESPPGLVVHTCAVTDDGLVVVDVWDSAEAFDGFARDRLSAALTDAGLGRPTPKLLPVHALLFGAGTEPNVLVHVHVAGVTADEYDILVSRMPALAGDGTDHPAVLHLAALEPDGLRNVGVWDSEESYKQFAESQLFPSIDNPRYFVLRVWPVYDYVRV